MLHSVVPRLRAVSYTHLDVYKRQHTHTPCYYEQRKKEIISFPLFFLSLYNVFVVFNFISRSSRSLNSLKIIIIIHRE